VNDREGVAQEVPATFTALAVKKIRRVERQSRNRLGKRSGLTADDDALRPIRDIGPAVGQAVIKSDGRNVTAGRKHLAVEDGLRVVLDAGGWKIGHRRQIVICSHAGGQAADRVNAGGSWAVAAYRKKCSSATCWLSRIAHPDRW